MNILRDAAARVIPSQDDHIHYKMREAINYSDIQDLEGIWYICAAHISAV